MVDATNRIVKSFNDFFHFSPQIIRLEGQVTRYKTASEAAEKVEDELKVEKRKLQREVLCTRNTLIINKPITKLSAQQFTHALTFHTYVLQSVICQG